MLQKVVYAGTQSASFVQATKDLKILAETTVSREQAQRWTKRVGEERCADMTAAATAYQQLPLPEQRRSPTGQSPAVACVQMDGGRMQVRPRHECVPRDPSTSFWRETSVGCLLSMKSVRHTEDPCPTIPAQFIDPQRIAKLCREIKGVSSAMAELPVASEPTESSRDECSERPQVLVRSVVATRGGIEALGPRLVAAAHARGFHAAERKAFVGDGSSSNWSVHQDYFSHYTPILDFIHALCYVYAAALAGRSVVEGWSDYTEWAQWLWSGDTASLIAALAARSAALGEATAADADGSPRRQLAETLGYVKNQSSRMKYAEYRCEGLPITSSAIESTIKQINRRVKGTEKFWDQGAEPILQLAADHLSETNDLSKYWRGRRHRIASTRRYPVTA